MINANDAYDKGKDASAMVDGCDRVGKVYKNHFFYKICKLVMWIPISDEKIKNLIYIKKGDK